MYLQLVEDLNNSALNDIIEINQQHVKDHLFFQQDIAPLHYALHVRQHLNQYFPRNWFERSGSIEWSPRLPDLSNLELSLRDT